TMGSWVLGLGLLCVLINGLRSLGKNGKLAPGNPWGAVTLEWAQCSSPPDPHNFHRTPLVTHGPYDFEVLFGGDGQSGDGHSQSHGTAPIPNVEVGAPQEDSSVDDGTSQPTPLA
ncbi:MAG TPA: cytochrome c oxidase subunit I, partial [Rubricoccaceae bacterium]